MTEEEKLAEEYAKANAKKGLSYREVTRTYDEITGYPYFLEDKIKKAFLAGLKAGRPKWHDLRKDPNDVPFQEKNEKWHIVLDNFGNKGFYDNIINKWRRLETLDIIEPTAWCELPKFEEIKEND